MFSPNDPSVRHQIDLARKLARADTLEFPLNGGTVTFGTPEFLVSGGTVSLAGTISTAHTFSALQTFSAGIKFANETLSAYDEGTWTPVITAATGAFTTLTYTNQSGKYTQIGNVVFFSYYIKVATFTIGTGSGNMRVSLPFTAASTLADSTRAQSSLEGIDLPGTPAGIAFYVIGGQAYGGFLATNDNAGATVVQISALASGDELSASGFFWVS